MQSNTNQINNKKFTPGVPEPQGGYREAGGDSGGGEGHPGEGEAGIRGDHCS